MDRLEELATRYRDEVLPKSPLRKVLGYVTNQKSALRLYLSDGAIPIDKNAVEREVRTVAAGRGNWTFIGSEDAGPWTARLYGLLGTCRLQGINPQEWLGTCWRGQGSIHPTGCTSSRHAAGAWRERADERAAPDVGGRTPPGRRRYLADLQPGRPGAPPWLHRTRTWVKSLGELGCEYVGRRAALRPRLTSLGQGRLRGGSHGNLRVHAQAIDRLLPQLETSQRSQPAAHGHASGLPRTAPILARPTTRSGDDARRARGRRCLTSAHHVPLAPQTTSTSSGAAPTRPDLPPTTSHRLTRFLRAIPSASMAPPAQERSRPPRTAREAPQAPPSSGQPYPAGTSRATLALHYSTNPPR